MLLNHSSMFFFSQILRIQVSNDSVKWCLLKIIPFVLDRTKNKRIVLLLFLSLNNNGSIQCVLLNEMKTCLLAKV